jgi:hypothetical protein
MLQSLQFFLILHQFLQQLLLLINFQFLDIRTSLDLFFVLSRLVQFSKLLLITIQALKLVHTTIIVNGGSTISRIWVISVIWFDLSNSLVTYLVCLRSDLGSTFTNYFIDSGHNFVNRNIPFLLLLHKHVFESLLLRPSLHRHEVISIDIFIFTSGGSLPSLHHFFFLFLCLVFIIKLLLVIKLWRSLS